MRRLMNYLRGIVTITVEGVFPERLINLCAQDRLEFWGLEWMDAHTLHLTVRRRDMGRLAALAQRTDCQVAVTGSRGLPDLLVRFRTRYAFLLGLAIALGAVAFLSRFVLTVEVTGNERVPTAIILNQLRQLGVGPGVYGPSIDRKQVAQEALLGLDELAWMGINLHGTRLEVIVREVLETPERLDETGFVDIVAEADGIITHVEAEQGDAVVREGDTVLQGETLISGTVTLEPPLYSPLPDRHYQTHARGRVWARTWRTISAVIPEQATIKEYTGAEKSAWTLQVLGARIEFFGTTSISWGFYDKITTVRQVVLPGEVALPIFLSRQTVREYEPRIIAVDAQAAQALLERQMLQRLEHLVGEQGEVLLTNNSVRQRDGLLYLILEAECQEEIGKAIPGTPHPDQETPERPEAES